MVRSIWKGSISFGLVNIPVGLFTAEERDEVSFRQLDRRSMSPIGYRKYNKENEKEVAQEDIVRGFEYEPGHYVVVTDEDMAKANPEATQTVEITDFVDAGEIDPIFFDKPYYLAPLGKAAKGYALLRETLKRSNKVGIAKVVIRSRQHLAAVIPVGKVLVLEILRYPDEIRKADDLDVPAEDIADVGVTPRELEMAERLVEGMTEPWDPTRYRDEYRDDLLSMIRRKAETGEVVSPAGASDEGAGRSDVIDIMSLLKRSVQETEKVRARPAAKPAARGKPAKPAPPSTSEKPARRRKSA
ncbi:MAG: putative repair protein Ku type [Gemmatimonadetes bacterium]|nr:putative repair protein Ku type [Gemmatimonadota bacterium]